MDIDALGFKGALCHCCSTPAAFMLAISSQIPTSGVESIVLHAACRGVLTIHRRGGEAKTRPCWCELKSHFYNMLPNCVCPCRHATVGQLKRISVLYHAAQLRLSMQACYNGATCS